MSDQPLDTIFADFVDGHTARVLRVKVNLTFADRHGALTIELPDGETTLRWEIESLRALPDQADNTAIVLGRAGDLETARLIIRDIPLAERLKQLCPHIKRVNKTPNLWRRLGILSVGAVSSVALLVFVLIPVMADQLATFLPPKGEQALGNSTFNQIRNALANNSELGLKICQSPSGDRALEKMRTRINDGADIPYDLQIYVLDHEMINAFALPGGIIVLFRGLLEDAESPEEVAGILGHEMGHVVHRDPTRLALRSAGSIGVLGLLLGDFAGGAAVLFLTERLIQASYSQDAEAASDVYAHQRLAEAGLPSSRMGDFFLRIINEYGNEPSLFSHLGSHPDLQGRVDAAIAADVVGRKNFRPVLTRGEWASLRVMCR